MSNERAINQIKDDIDSMKETIRYRQTEVDRAIADLICAKMKIDELKLNIKNQEAAIKILQGEHHE